MRTWSHWAVSTCLLFVGVPTSHAAVVAVDCAKKGSLNTELGKLNRAVANTLLVSGTCAENIVITGHKELSIQPAPGGTGVSINGTVSVGAASKVDIGNLDLVENTNAQLIGVSCDERSICRLTGPTRIVVLGYALRAQQQSAIDVVDNVGSSTIRGSVALGVYGASAVNAFFKPGGDSRLENLNGDFMSVVEVQDGSFARVDNAYISTDSPDGTGVFVQRGAIAKILNTSVTASYGSAFFVRAANLQLEASSPSVSITHGTGGVVLGPLGYARIGGTPGNPLTFYNASGTTEGHLVCFHPTGVADRRNVSLTGAGASSSSCP